MDEESIVRGALKKLREGGAEQAQVYAEFKDRAEFNGTVNGLTLLREIDGEAELELTAVKGDRSASASSNVCDADSAAAECCSAADTAAADPGARMNTKPDFMDEHSGAAPVPDTELLCGRINELYRDVQRDYPLVRILQLYCTHVHARRHYVNTHGTSLREDTCFYRLTLNLLPADAEFTGTMNRFSVSLCSLDAPLINNGVIKSHFESAARQRVTFTPERKRRGTLVLTPDSMEQLFSMAMNTFGGRGMLLSGSARWQHSIGQTVAAEGINISSLPGDPRIADKCLFTKDGFPAEDMPIIEGGVLKGLCVDEYTAARTGLRRGGTYDGCHVMLGGDRSLADIIGDIEYGVLLGYYCGGAMSAAGQLSGLAKNSFIIENGKLGNAVSGTMVSGEFTELLKNVRGISSEQLESGLWVMPYAAFDGAVIS